MTSSLAAGQAAEPLWVYLTVYKEYAATLKAGFEKKNPGIDVQLFQAGSEKIQSKVEAELLAQKLQADLLMTSDPFFSVDLEKRGLLLVRPGHKVIETNYNSVMVMICNRALLPADRPVAFSDLTQARFKNKTQIGSPLESGTFFTTVAYLENRYGWDYFKKLRENGVSSNGGNSTVIQKVESGEKKVGIALLENVLAAQKRGSPIDVIYPTDGGIVIPSTMVIMKNTSHSEAASRFSAYITSAEGQKLLREGLMYPVLKTVPDPDGAKPLNAVTRNATPWTPELMKKIADESREIKKKFSDLVLE